MMKHLSFFLFALCSLFLAACSLPSAPPATVTDPAVRDLYASALAGNGDALYSVSHMYGEGTNGFPQSSWYSSIALEEAADRNQPQAIYDLAVQDLSYVRNKLTSNHARNDTYKSWNEVEDDLVKVRRDVARAASLGDARAANTLAAIDEDMARYNQLTARERAHYTKCPRCNGEGKAWEPRHHGPGKPGKPGKHDKHEDMEYTTCHRCDGKGFVAW